jgi:spermidine/putrescine transport system permease protein
MIANIVANLFGADYNWPLGAAVAAVILLIVVALLYLTEGLERRWRAA